MFVNLMGKILIFYEDVRLFYKLMNNALHKDTLEGLNFVLLGFEVLSCYLVSGSRMYVCKLVQYEERWDQC